MITNDGQDWTIFIDAWVAQMAELHRAGRELLLVTSGAGGRGHAATGLEPADRAVRLLQAAAAVG